jgi:hypothetical protein
MNAIIFEYGYIPNLTANASMISGVEKMNNGFKLNCSFKKPNSIIIEMIKAPEYMPKHLAHTNRCELPICTEAVSD